MRNVSDCYRGWRAFISCIWIMWTGGFGNSLPVNPALASIFLRVQ